MFKDRAGIKEVMDERGNTLAVIEPIKEGILTTVFTSDGKRSFQISEVRSQSGGTIIRSIAKSGCETVYYES